MNESLYKLVYPKLPRASDRGMTSSLSPYRRPKDEIEMINQKSTHFRESNRMRVTDYNQMNVKEMVQDLNYASSPDL